MEKINVTGIPANEGFFDKCKRKAKTAVNWGKTHWKGLALGAVAIGGGAYMLSRRGNGEDEPVRGTYLGSSGADDLRAGIDETFAAGDGSDIGPSDDDPEIDDE